MKLVTFQPYGFDICNNISDVNKSLNLYFDDIFLRSYNWLFKKLNNNKFIWCYINKSDNCRNYLRHGIENVIWYLNVPDNECIIINSEVWDCVINNYPYCKDEDLLNISDNEYDELIKSLEPTKEKIWGENIFNIEDDNIEVLIKSPVNENYITSKEWVCGYNTKLFNDEIIRRLYYDINTAEHEKLIYESFLNGRNIKYKSELKESNNNFILNIEW